MDLSMITFNGEFPKKQNQLQGPRPSPLQVGEQFSLQAKCTTPFAKQTTRMIRGARKNHQPKIVYSVLANGAEFKSMVRRLTGALPVAASHTPLKNMASEERKAYVDMQQCLMLNAKDVCAECLDCLAYCSLFPKDYELERDTLVQLWVAAGLIKEQPEENIGDAYLMALLECSNGIISLSREDQGNGKIWYKVNASQLSQQRLELSRISPVRVASHDEITTLSIQTKPCHVMLENPPKNLEVLGRLTQMRSLLLMRGCQSNAIDHVPYDLFMSLEHLQALDLSGTRIEELPSSIGNARCLCYLDLSETLIKQLPETIDGAQSLQTLKLRNCPRLIKLPKGTKRLTMLRHLDLGTLCRLHTMPPGMGALSSLCTLSDFVVGEESGCSIGELKGMNNLRGKICLSRLENVASPEEAVKANLTRKKHLTKLELRWTTNHDMELEESNKDDDLKIIQNLWPPSNLQDLRIICYGGSSFPSWISYPIFPKLSSITLFKCENCQILPSLGKLRSLESLSLIELVEVKSIDFCFYGNMDTNNIDNFIAFPRLQKLVIKSLSKLGEWRDMEKQDFPRLTKLEIKDCPKLAALCRLSSLKSLEYLEINGCTKLQSLLESDLPASMKMLVVEDCPSISMRCSMHGKEWHKIEHNPSLLVYQRDEGKQGGVAASSRVNAYTQEKEKVVIC